MNNIFLIALMDDWQMSARLAKISSIHSYELLFCENGLQLPDAEAQSVLIIDLDSIDADEIQKANHLKNDNSVFIIGYAREVGGTHIKHFTGLGYDMVLKRKKLLRNIDTILQKVIHAH